MKKRQATLTIRLICEHCGAAVTMSSEREVCPQCRSVCAPNTESAAALCRMAELVEAMSPEEFDAMIAIARRRDPGAHAMTPQFQKIIDKDKGDCNAACVATITGIPLGDLPNGDGHKFGYYGALQDFLDEHGWVYIEIGPVLYWWLFYPLKNVPVIASVPSQMFEDRMHAIVATVDDSDQLVVLHDPNPGNKPYDLSLQGVPKAYSMLIRREGLPSVTT